MAKVLILFFWLMSAASLHAAPAQRVVSMNLCTDQLAMLIAGPDQLISVSNLASDPHYSSMADEAGRYHLNSGQAEEIAFLRPDLVLAGSYTTATTVNMLNRLGYQVEIFEPENSLADIRANIEKMGKVLGRQARAAEILAQTEAQLAQHLASLAPDRPKTLLYYQGGYTAGDGGFAADILRHAGLDNMAPDLGLKLGGALALEVLVLANPQLILRGQSYNAPSRSQDMLSHPALLARFGPAQRALSTSAEWTCGTPFTIDMIEELAQKAREIQKAPEPLKAREK